ncbi:MULTISPECIES: ATP-binding protein [unclassified Streptomyces]|uniref:ATP-binding protein n=1 Tax=unclassified Streptomyces TaxID=2593676 RepID=UPI00225420C7|nr:MULTISPECIES: ATP-binding protein [unclassified Streptomyces]MCX5063863.1 ATP-binding protein [Streptomyces sp. NBC_00452]
MSYKVAANPADSSDPPGPGAGIPGPPVGVPAPRDGRSLALSLALPWTSTAAGKARTLIRVSLLHTGVPDFLTQTVELLVTELVTNALRHAAPPLNLSAIYRQAATPVLSCAVSDGSSELPALCHPSMTCESGRGLVLVDSLSDRWGSHRTPGGKIVWCELNLSLHPRAFMV